MCLGSLQWTQVLTWSVSPSRFLLELCAQGGLFYFFFFFFFRGGVVVDPLGLVFISTFLPDLIFALQSV